MPLASNTHVNKIIEMIQFDFCYHISHTMNDDDDGDDENTKSYLWNNFVETIENNYGNVSSDLKNLI